MTINQFMNFCKTFNLYPTLIKQDHLLKIFKSTSEKSQVKKKRNNNENIF
jgi:hypothetical protein